jgi:hypothetical protein
MGKLYRGVTKSSDCPEPAKAPKLTKAEKKKLEEAQSTLTNAFLGKKPEDPETSEI